MSPSSRLFKLNSNFLARFKYRKPKFSYNGLGELVYRRTYSRVDLSTGKKEQWIDTVQRVVEGIFSIQQRHLESNNLPLPKNITGVSEKMFELIYDMRFLPPGRGLWAMGTQLIEKKKLYSALNNCAFVSTQNLSKKKAQPFLFTMDSLMLGVGVGFDTRGSDSLYVVGPIDKPFTYIIPDDREGWVESVKFLLDSYFCINQRRVEFDYSLVRKAGLPLKTFGGTSAGPGPLKDLHKSIKLILERQKHKYLNSRSIADIMNLIAKCVVAGNIRRSSQIALGEFSDNDFMNLKNYDQFPERREWGWCSNNSVIANSDTDYDVIAEQLTKNGEPGLLWLENARQYGRMNDGINNKDSRAMGVNPCGEQTLESYEMCNLVEVFLNRNNNITEFLESIRYATLYAKTVSLCIPINLGEDTSDVMSRNRRIGVSLSGIYEFLSVNGRDSLIDHFNVGYQMTRASDKVFSRIFKVPESIKTTTVKPSGTISLLTGATPGVHAPVGGQYHIRRIQMSDHDPNLPSIIRAGYRVENSISTPNAVVVEFPVKLESNLKSQNEISVEEQLDLAILAQKYWSDNQVSCTATFSKREVDNIPKLLKDCSTKLKGISLLPKFTTEYQQMPYETITPDQYYYYKNTTRDITWDEKINSDAIPEKYCSNDSCSV